MRACVNGLTSILFFVLFSLQAHGVAQEATIESTQLLAAKELALTLQKMGYHSIEIRGTKLKFARDLENSCPSDRALSYLREIDLRNLDMTSISEIGTDISGQRMIFYFWIEPTEDYRRRAYPILGFIRKVKRDYPGSNWPFNVDENLPEIRRKFLQEFPGTMNLNRWIDKTCYGENPSLNLIFHMSFDDRGRLSEFRAALINYARVVTVRK